MVWKIVKVNNNTSGPTQAIVMRDCTPVVGNVTASSWEPWDTSTNWWIWGAVVDTWAVDINGRAFYYEGEGEVTLTIESDGAFTASGQINTVQGKLKPYYA